MLSRCAQALRLSQRSFSTSSARRYDLAKLTLIGRLGRDPELRTTQNSKEYVAYTVATANYPPPPPNPDGSRPAAKVSWHHVLCFNPASYDFLKSLQKGTHVYVEANYELREPDSAAEPDSPQAQRQIFLRHDTIRVLKYPASSSQSEDSSSSEN